MEKYIQVGVTALRDPVTGDFLRSVPLYIREDDEAAAEAHKLEIDIARVFADKFGQYVQGVRHGQI